MEVSEADAVQAVQPAPGALDGSLGVPDEHAAADAEQAVQPKELDGSIFR